MHWKLFWSNCRGKTLLGGRYVHRQHTTAQQPSQPTGPENFCVRIIHSCWSLYSSKIPCRIRAINSSRVHDSHATNTHFGRSSITLKVGSGSVWGAHDKSQGITRTTRNSIWILKSIVMALGQDFVIVDTPKRISKFTKNEMRVTASKTLVDCFGISRLTECVCVCHKQHACPGIWHFVATKYGEHFPVDTAT